MRRILWVLATIAVLGVLGWNVKASQDLLATGDTVLLELAPRDPRSLMQGDYMQLTWALERTPDLVPDGESVAILGLDDQRIGSFRRWGSQGAAQAGEIAFRIGKTARYGSIVVEPHSFLFQEGQAAIWQGARYGIFRVDGHGRHLLAGLADARAQPITPVR